MVERTMVNRRTALKGIAGVGGLAATGLGGIALMGSGAALSTSFTADPVTVASDTGDVDEVHVAPTTRVEWADFDVPVTKVRQLIEARLEDEGGNPLTPGLTQANGGTAATENNWWPIWRETPWLFTTTDPGDGSPPDFDYRGSDAWFAQPSYATDYGIDGGAGQKSKGTTGLIDYPLAPSSTPSGRVTGGDTNIYVVAEAAPMPDYPTVAGSLSGATLESLLDGTSIAGGGNFYNGSYGTVAGALGADGSTVFDNPTDDSDLVRTVRLRLTTSLHTDYDFAENAPSPLPDDRLSPLAMGASPDVGHQFANPHTITYDDLRANAASHPAIDVVETSFTVTATNQPTDTGSQTTGNTGGS